MRFGTLAIPEVMVKPVCVSCNREVGTMSLERILRDPTPKCPKCGRMEASAYTLWLETWGDLVPEWRHFDNFIRDVGPRPSTKHTLYRRDASRAYGPKNATRWATHREKLRPSVRIKADHREHFKRLYPEEAKNFDKYWRDHCGHIHGKQGWVLTPKGWEDRAIPTPLTPGVDPVLTPTPQQPKAEKRSDDPDWWGCDCSDRWWYNQERLRQYAIKSRAVFEDLDLYQSAVGVCLEKWKVWAGMELEKVTDEWWSNDFDLLENMHNPDWWKDLNVVFNRWWYRDKRLRAYAQANLDAYIRLNGLTRETIRPIHYEVLERKTHLGLTPLPRPKEEYPWE